MACDEMPDDLKILWKEAGTDRPMFSPDQLRQETEKIRARRRRSHVVLIVAFSVVVACLAGFFFYFRNPLTRIGAILGILAYGYWVIYILRERARTVPDPGETDGVGFYRAELERMRDWHGGMRAWRMSILVPPFILYDFGLAQTFAKLAPWTVLFVWFDCTIFLGLLAIWAPIKHRKTARKYQERIDTLDAAIRSEGR